jgi:hypothetical protein
LKHERVLGLALRSRKRHVFRALRLVTAIRAERGRIVAGNLERLAGGVKLMSVLALRANVSRQVRLHKI